MKSGQDICSAQQNKDVGQLCGGVDSLSTSSYIKHFIYDMNRRTDYKRRISRKRHVKRICNNATAKPAMAMEKGKKRRCMLQSTVKALLLEVPIFDTFLSTFHRFSQSWIKVSFVSTPRNIKRLPEIPPSLADLVEFVEFPLPSLDDDVLPEDGEATVDIPAEKIEYLKIAYDLLKHPLKQFIADQLPDWIIIDVIPYWMVDIARENKIPLILFSVSSAAAFVFLGHPRCLIGDGQKRLRPSWMSTIHHRPAFECIGITISAIKLL
uniref:Uncharacterized protein n=1 Tax=Salix viminalis TaxID=40686 RepID=A0A6N2JWN1_SALVM